MAAVYAEMRQEEAQAQVPHSYTTARTLLSILRLSQALARLRFSDYVCQVLNCISAMVLYPNRSLIHIAHQSS